MLGLFLVTPASAAPGKSCSIMVKAGGLDSRCLPAISSRGTLIAVAAIDPDGRRGDPNLTVRFLPLDGRGPASTVILTVDEVEEIGKGRLGPAVVSLIEPRLDLVNAQLAAAGFVSLRSVEIPPRRLTFHTESGGLDITLKDGTLEIGGPRTEPETLALPRASSGGDCAAANAPFVSGLWLSSDDDRRVVVQIGYAENDSCPAPQGAWRVIRPRAAAGAPVAAPAPDRPAQPRPGPAATQPEQASALNTRGMRKFRAKDFSGAAADFRAAIDASSTHVKAHYNLACLASVTRDRETALTELRWLAASGLSEAAEKLHKARTDPDMAFIRAEPEAQKLLGER